MELQLQGLVGPTHHYAGLGLGNVASAKHAGQIANPREAALQSCQLWRWLIDQGVPLAVMPPQTRPRLDVLEKLGFSGSVAEQLDAAHKASPSLLRSIYSSSFMWTANAATVTASSDSGDGKLHLTPANLISSLHRMLEAREAEHLLQKIFSGNDIIVHPPLNVTTRLADEGAANHMRLCSEDGTQSMQLFTYGAQPPDSVFPAQHMPRQQRAASEAICESHQLPETQQLFAQQSPEAIDAGVFHHDVIGLSHRNLLVIHKKAWVNQTEVLEELTRRAPWLTIREIRNNELSLQDAVDTYFFNAQLVSLPSGNMGILFPQECAENKHTQRLTEELKTLPMVEDVSFWDLRQSMQNGGGPACLRLRVPLSSEELATIHSGVRLNIKKIQQIERFVATRYRNQVTLDDLRDATFAEEALSVQRDLLRLLNITPLYF